MKHLICAAGILLVAGCAIVHAQNTIKPTPLHTRFSTLAPGDDPLRAYLTYIDSTSTFARTVDEFLLGHQWGAGRYMKVNGALSANFTNEHWSYGTNWAALRRLDTTRPNYLGWSLNAWGDGENEAPKVRFTRPWIGVRYEPAENAGSGPTWTPRDAASWPWSFSVRQHGQVINTVSDPNYRRFVLDTALISGTMPALVLDKCEPRTQLHVVNKHFVAEKTGSTSQYQYDETVDGRRMYLVINLRRLSGTENTMDDTPVLKLKVQGIRNRAVDSLDRAPVYFNFTKQPESTGTSITTLGDNRGKVLGMDPVVDYPNEIIVTQRQLPAGSDRDITIVAEFRTDVIREPESPFNIVVGTLKHRILAPYKDNGDYDHLIDTVTPQVWFYDNVSVAIQSVSIVSPTTFSAITGEWDGDFATAIGGEIKKIRNCLADFATFSQQKLRVAHFYTRDEFEHQETLGMVYRGYLLDSLLSSETGYAGERFDGYYLTNDFGKQRFHILPFRQKWTSGLGMPERFTASPALAFTKWYWENDSLITADAPDPYPSLKIKSGYRRGADNLATALPYNAQYESMIATKYSGTFGSVVGMNPPLSSTYQRDSVYQYALKSDVGPLAAHEAGIFMLMKQTGSTLFTSRIPWLANFFYHLDPSYKKTNTGKKLVRFEKFRPLTGEEVRLQIGACLAFGAKGLVYDKFFGEEYAFPDPASVSNGDEVGYQVLWPGLVTTIDKVTDWDTRPSATYANILAKDSLGADFMVTGDAMKMDQWVNMAALADSMALGASHTGTAADRIYLGRKSARLEVKKWHDLIMDPTTKSIIYRMHPLAWLGKGYRTLTNGTFSHMTNWIDTAAFTMYRWTKTSKSAANYTMVAEPSGERFFDVVILDTLTGAPGANECVIAVTNRRTAPFLIDAALSDSVRFRTTQEFDQLLAGSPELRYRQMGARRLMLPIDYQYDPGMPSLLHVREVTLDDANRLDTVTGSTAKLAIDLRPGETRFFHVKRLRAVDTAAAGFLAFSTQNKLVAYPVPKADYSGYTDSIRYHMVYHRRDNAPLRTGPWTVYYVRSRPYRRDSVPDVAGLDWETPIRLSVGTTLSRPRTDAGQTRTQLSNVTPIEYDSMITTQSSMLDLSCGFPSIVVREYSSNRPRIHVVYTCQDLWAQYPNRLNFFHVVENYFDDGTTLTAGAVETNGRSLAVVKKNIGHDIDSLKDLATFGTPVVNAAGNGTMYYAWSASNAGIGAGTKLTTQQWFPLAGAIATVPTPTIGTLVGGGARYPTLNPYSNIAQSNATASLAWQENGQIRYTRLSRNPANGLIGRFLPSFIAMSFDTGTPYPIPYSGADAIAVMSDTSHSAESRYPVIVRSLQPDTMSVFIDDPAGPYGTYTYNHESIAWEEYLTGDGLSQIRYRHFFDMMNSTQLHYWWTGRTYASWASLFHPVLTNGDVRLDSLTWMGVVGGTVETYNDSLKILRGNVADSALILNYNVLSDYDFNDLRTARDDIASFGSYWTGYKQFPMLSTQQITLRTFPGVPGSVAPPVLHTEFLRAGGPWPHLAARHQEFKPRGIQSVRRVLQYTNDPTPSLLASAESFYRVSETEGGYDPPVTLSGFDVGNESFAIRAALDDGRTLTFDPSVPVSVPGYEGSADIRALTSVMLAPVRTLTTQPFDVGDVNELHTVTTGRLREDVIFAIEELDPETDTAIVSTTLNLPAAEDTSAADRCTWYLTSGGNRRYRLRVTYDGTAPMVRHQDIDLGPERERFGKGSAALNARVVDLSKRTAAVLGTASSLSVYPNPASDRATVIIGGAGVTREQLASGRFVLDIADAGGHMVMSNIVAFGEAVDIVGLPSGAYHIRLRHEVGQNAVVVGTGVLTVVR